VRARNVDAVPALPDGSPELIFNLADPFQAFAVEGVGQVQPPIMLVGQISAPFVVGPTGRVDLVAVRLQSYGAALLHPPVSLLTDGWTDQTGLRSPAISDRLAVLRDALLATADREARVALLDEALTELLHEAPGFIADPRVVRAVQAIRANHGVIALDALTRQLHTTTRTLQRLFAAQVGISPKLLTRITRFDRVFGGWRDDPRSLARVAAEGGYFDQSHLVRDFRDFAGAAPAACLVAQPEFTAFFTSGSPVVPTR